MRSRDHICANCSTFSSKGAWRVARNPALMPPAETPVRMSGTASGTFPGEFLEHADLVRRPRTTTAQHQRESARVRPDTHAGMLSHQPLRHRPRPTGMMDLLRDLRQGFRLLRRAPGFAVTAIFTLALGIGATTALFTVVNAVLLEPLPFPDSNRLVQVWRSELPALTYGSASYGRYLDWRREQRPFTELGAWAPAGMTIAGPEGPERVGGAQASASFFRVVGVSPLIGRFYSDDDDQRGAEKVAVISEALWRRRFNGSPTAIGARMQIDGEPYTVIGVAPAAFSEVWRPELWIPLAQVADANNRGSNYLLSFGRMREGQTMASVRGSLGELAAQMSREHADDKYSFTARPLHDVITEGATTGTVGPAWRHQPADADRVHQRRQPPAGARGGARA